MPKLSDLFPSTYLKADDIPDEGLIVTITGCEMVELGMGADKETKPCLSFKEEKKGLVCNKTNCQTIATLTGSDDTDDWEGHKIKLITMEVAFQGKMGMAIRVSPKPVKAATKKVVAQVEEEEQPPFDEATGF